MWWHLEDTLMHPIRGIQSHANILWTWIILDYTLCVLNVLFFSLKLVVFVSFGVSLTNTPEWHQFALYSVSGSKSSPLISLNSPNFKNIIKLYPLSYCSTLFSSSSSSVKVTELFSDRLTVTSCIQILQLKIRTTFWISFCRPANSIKLCQLPPI